jgi:hypothetical protein
MIARFEFGQVAATPRALRALEEAGEKAATFVDRHISGDWGELDDFDRLENEISLAEGNRLLSSYSLSTGAKLWIITEADRSVTTLLLPSEY